MRYANFAISKVKKCMKAYGRQYYFIRRGKNEFGESDETDFPQVIIVNGVYHEQSSYITDVGSDSGVIQNVKTPMILVSYDDYIRNEILQDDLVEFNSQRYKVSGTTNIQEGNFAIEISLEVIQ